MPEPLVSLCRKLLEHLETKPNGMAWFSSLPDAVRDRDVIRVFEDKGRVRFAMPNGVPLYVVISEDGRTWLAKRRLWGSGKPLSETERRVYKVIVQEGPVTSPIICARAFVNQSVLTSHIIPALKKKRGVINDRRIGYYSPRHYTPH